jgi:hypothetical protein
MVRPRLLCGFFVAVAALAQLVVWLVIRPDLAGPQWSEGGALEAWLGLEALTVVVIGCAAPARGPAVAAVLAGWALQVAHFGFLGAHYDDTLWGIGLFGQAVLAAAGVGLALGARALAGRAVRRPPHG